MTEQLKNDSTDQLDQVTDENTVMRMYWMKFQNPWKL
jgi:hypothetical protein